MIIAGPCLFSNISEKQMIVDTAKELKNFADIFRCKIIGGGTTPSKYIFPKDDEMLETLAMIDREIMPVATEIHIPEQLYKISDYGIKHVWIGARNSSNYSLLEKIAPFDGEIYLKRGVGVTIDETIGIYDIMRIVHHKKIHIIERGINTFDRLNDSRWSPDLKGVIRIKNERKDIFEKLIVDCSHSVGCHEYIKDTYTAFKSIGVNNFMFECTLSGKSKTDARQMLSVDNLKEILGWKKN